MGSVTWNTQPKYSRQYQPSTRQYALEMAMGSVTWNGVVSGVETAECSVGNQRTSPLARFGR